MPTVAEQLRAAREQQKLSVEQVAELTKIRTDHVRALDAGDYEVFPAPVYVRGFVRTYSTLLKLDATSLQAALEKELAELPKFSDSPELKAPGHTLSGKVFFTISQLNWPIVLGVLGGVVVLLAVVFGYRAWHERKSRDQNLDLGPGLYQSGKSNLGEILPLPPSPAK